MQADDARQVLRLMGAIWNMRSDDHEAVVVWLDTLSHLPAEATRKAVFELRDELDWPPTHRQLNERTHAIARRLEAQRALPGSRPATCRTCDGSGWFDAATISRSPAMQRCSCKPESAEHRSGCTCVECHYGSRARLIKEGRDGAERPAEEADALAVDFDAPRPSRPSYARRAVATPAAARAYVTAMRTQLAEASGPLASSLAHVVMAPPAPVPATAHDLGDHQFCGPECPVQPPPPSEEP